MITQNLHFFLLNLFRERAKGLHVNILEENSICYTTQSVRLTYAKKGGKQKTKEKKTRLL